MPRSGQVISHWYSLVDGFNTSTLEFYKAVEEAVKAREVPDAKFSRVVFKEGGVGSAEREYLRIMRNRVAFDIGAAPYGTGFFFSWWLVRVGPAHAWIWPLVAFGALFIWSLILLSSLSQMLAGSLFGQQAGAGCFFWFVLITVPAAIFGLGWSVREGYLGDEDVVLATPIIGWVYERLFSPQTYYRYDTALMFQESVRRAVNEVIEGLLSGQGLKALSDDQLKPTIRDLAR